MSKNYALCRNKNCDIIILLPSLNWQQKGGAAMEFLASFILSVLAGVVAYYICKWLDEENQSER